jgi:hypothetical protein
MTQSLDTCALASSPIATQFFIWSQAPKIGLNKRLHLAAASGFQSAGACTVSAMLSRDDLGGEYGLVVMRMPFFWR